MKRWAGVVVAGALVVAACGSSGGGSAPSGGGGGSSPSGGSGSVPVSEANAAIKNSCIRNASKGATVTEKITSSCQCVADYVMEHATPADLNDKGALTDLATKAGHACT